MTMSELPEDLIEILRSVETLSLNRDIAGLQAMKSNIEQQERTLAPSEHTNALLHALNGYEISLTGDSADAIEHFSKAATAYDRLGSTWNSALMTLRIGEALYAIAQYKRAMSSYMQAYEQFSRLKDDAQTARLAENMGIVHLRLGNLEESTRWYNEAISIQELLDNRRDVLRLYANLGNLFLERGEVDRAMANYETALAGFRELGMKPAIASLMTNIGICYADKADYPNALIHLHEAIEVGRETDHKVSMSAATGAIGEIYEACADYHKALHWFEESLKYAQSTGRTHDVCTKRVQIGIAWLHMGKLDAAATQLEQALTIAIEIENVRILNRVHAYLAMVHLGRNRIAEARSLVNSVLASADQSGLVRDLLAFKMVDASVARAEKDHGRCVQLLENVIQSAESMSADKEHSEALFMKYQVTREQGRYCDALEVLELFMGIHDRYLGQQKQRHMAILETEHTISEQAREHERLITQERKLRDQQRRLLTNMLPEQIADRLLAGEEVIADRFEDVSVLFIDLVNFTGLASDVEPEQILVLLNNVFKSCDTVVKKHGLTKIKTIGDAYMAIAGAPIPQADHIVRMAKAALEIRTVLGELRVRIPDGYGDKSWIESVGEIEVRMGIHCGPVSAGIIGEERMAYDVWGDTVNISARMEQSGMPGFIQVTSQFRKLLLEMDSTAADFVSRGEVEVKGRGKLETWWMYEHEG